MEEIITDEQINKVHANAQFGDTPKRDVVNYALLKCACGYHNGHTAQQIIAEHGLIYDASQRGPIALTALGSTYLWAAFGRTDY